MEWESLSEDAKPLRYLTEEEIQYVLDHFPASPSADPEAAELSREYTVDWIRGQLEEVMMDSEDIDALISTIVSDHQLSLIPPGSPVGITAAEAVGAGLSQMTLNTFHKSGSSKTASGGIEAMRELIFAKKKKPGEGSCTIHFTNKQASFEEISKTREYIVGCAVADFVKDSVIDSPENLPKFWWHEAQQLMGKEIPSGVQYIIRLYLNLDTMLKYHVTIQNLVDILEYDKNLVGVYGSMQDGILDLYPNKSIGSIKNMDKIPPQLLDLTYLETIVLPELKRLRVIGVPGITNLIPIRIPIWNMVVFERKYTPRDIRGDKMSQIMTPYLGRGWLLFLDQDFMNLNGLTAENLAALCSMVGMGIIGTNEQYLAVHLEGIPSETISRELSQARRNIKNRNEREVQRIFAEREQLPESEKKYVRREVVSPKDKDDELIRASELIIAETEGSNLKDLLSLPGIDSTRTTCDNIFTINTIFGVEAARTCLTRALKNTIEQTGSYVHPAHIMIIAAFIMSRGSPYGATFTGVSRQPCGHLSLATLEQAGKVFINSGLFGRKEDIRNVSASVVVGGRMAIGNGTFDIAQDIEDQEGQSRVIMSDNLFTYVDSFSHEKLQEGGVPQNAEIFHRMESREPTFDYTEGEEADINLMNIDSFMASSRPVQKVQLPSPSSSIKPLPKKPIDDLISSIDMLIPSLKTEGLEEPPNIEMVTVPDFLRTSILENLLEKYFSHMLEVVPLPTIPVRALPRISVMPRNDVDVRREQLKNLQPIDTEALMKVLGDTSG